MTCVILGLSRFFVDLGVNPFNVPGVLTYLSAVRDTYEQNRPDPSDFLAKIEEKGFIQSVEGDAKKIVFAMGLLSLTLIIASIAFCVTFLVSVFIIREPMYAITTLTIYLVFIVLLYYFSRYLFTGAGRSIVVPSIEEELQAYFLAQKKALDTALCTKP